MKTFKLIDVWISIILISCFAIVCISNSEFLFYAYFIIGGWQIISMVIHAFTGWFMKKGGARQLYIYTVAIILSLVLLGLFCEPFLIIFFFLLVGSPILALVYTHICYTELNELKQRELLSLK
jgi:hypothetical protein